jgi:hypothetical protein
VVWPARLLSPLAELCGGQYWTPFSGEEPAWPSMLASSTCSSSEAERLDSFLRGGPSHVVWPARLLSPLAELCSGQYWTPSQGQSQHGLQFKAGVIYLQ